ncbi:MAG: TrmH family RNA methyltransferase [Saprospiraceae bacterium]
MLSKSNIKYINSLKAKKFRQKYHKFIAEGDKIVKEMLENPQISFEKIFCTEKWAATQADLLRAHSPKVRFVTDNELNKISSLQTPNQVLVIAEQLNNSVEATKIENGLSLVLETMQDPGNMGTILRIADWFGIEQVFCSKDCVDIYNSKVVQASMGAFLRVNVQYLDLEELFKRHSTLPVYGAMLGGDNIFEMELAQKGFIVIGNEGRGISDKIANLLTHKIEIPKYGGAESLNAAVATGIICSIFKK